MLQLRNVRPREIRWNGEFSGFAIIGWTRSPVPCERWSRWKGQHFLSIKCCKWRFANMRIKTHEQLVSFGLLWDPVVNMLHLSTHFWRSYCHANNGIISGIGNYLSGPRSQVKTRWGFRFSESRSPTLNYCFCVSVEGLVICYSHSGLRLKTSPLSYWVVVSGQLGEGYCWLHKDRLWLGHLSCICLSINDFHSSKTVKLFSLTLPGPASNLWRKKLLPGHCHPS